jgi:L-lactate dehydrogenase complex protein LldG
MAQAENPGRERILERIRAALREPAPRHAPSGARGAAFAPIDDPLDRFQKECVANITECVVVPDSGASAAAIADLLGALPPGEIFVQDAPELRRMADAWRASRGIRWSTAGGPAESSQATITLAEALVAQTGSVFVSSACGGRGASAVAPVHIVVANATQLAPSLEDAFVRLREREAPAKNSMLCLITGSSRTADIEKILVMGAHGPRRLIVVLALSPE